MSVPEIYNKTVTLFPWRQTGVYGFDEDMRLLFTGWKSFTRLNVYLYRGEAVAPFKYDGLLVCPVGKPWSVVHESEWWLVEPGRFNMWDPSFDEMVRVYFQNERVYRLYLEFKTPT